MANLDRKKRKHSILKVIGIGLGIILGVLALYIGLHFTTIKERIKDYQALSSSHYDTAFLSMYPLDGFEEEYYSHYRGMELVKTSYSIPDFKTLNQYMKYVAKSGNTIHTIYLGIIPEKIALTDLQMLIGIYPSVTFEVVPAYPSLEYWSALSALDYEASLQAYYEYATWALETTNANLYAFFSREWLIGNPSNYLDTYVTNTDQAKSIMLYTDKDHGQQFTTENIDAIFSQFDTLIMEQRTNPFTYPDLSNWDIVFLGDSVIGNYRDTTSIPQVLRALTDANVYNWAIGGTSAAIHPDLPCTLTCIVDDFLQQKPCVSAAENQALASESMEQYYKSDKKENLCFILHFGLNDYFTGVPIQSEDALDTTTFMGAMSYAIEKLQAAYPKAQILLMAPNFTTEFHNGTDKNGEAGGTLADYVQAVLSLGEKYHLMVQNDFIELPIQADNHTTYLVDGTHLNEAGRFLTGKLLTEKIRN